MSGLELYEIVEDFFGYKVRKLHYNQETKVVEGILYDAFYLECNVNDRYERFGAGLALGKEAVITEFLAKLCSLNGDEESIRRSLQIIDDYCRMRLPDKFLEAYETGQKIKKNLSGTY